MPIIAIAISDAVVMSLDPIWLILHVVRPWRSQHNSGLHVGVADSGTRSNVVAAINFEILENAKQMR